MGPIIELNNENLFKISEDIRKPAYERDKLKIGIVQIGPSNFARGHLATFVDDAIDSLYKQDDPRWQHWGICAVSLQAPDQSKRNTRDILKPHDNLYTVVERSKDNPSARIIGCIKDIMVAQERDATPEQTQQARDAIIDRMANADTKLITLTVTQTGYKFTPGKDKGLCHETLDYIAEALEKRFDDARAQGKKPEAFTIMSCDNIPHNGTNLRHALALCISERPKDFRDWVRDQVPIIPATMVDRIVPGTEQSQLSILPEKYGYSDKGVIFTEKFRQFVIANTPNATLPPQFENMSGVMMVDEVSPYELAKLRILNGTHLALGMLGRLHNHETTSAALQDPEIKSFIKGFMKEVSGTLSDLPGMDMQTYCNNIYSRLADPALDDQLQRLARNSSDKLQTRVLDPLSDAYMKNLPHDHMVKTVALWVKYLQAGAREGYDIVDESAEKKGLMRVAAGLNGSVESLLGTDVFGKLLNDVRFARELDKEYSELHNKAVLPVFARNDNCDNDNDTSSTTSGGGGPSVEEIFCKRAKNPQSKPTPP